MSPRRRVKDTRIIVVPEIIPVKQSPQEYGADRERIKQWKKERNFQNELKRLLNQYSQEGSSGTPDFILATYLQDCLRAFEAATIARDDWHGQPKYNKTRQVMAEIQLAKMKEKGRSGD